MDPRATRRSDPRAITPYRIDRGDLVWLDFNPQSGHEQAGRRPAVVLSPSAYDGKVGLALVCPVTSQITGYPFEVPLPSSVELKGAILADQVKSLDWRVRRAEVVGRLPAATVSSTLDLLRVLAIASPSRSSTSHGP